MAGAESQRDSVPQPRVARHGLPWVIVPEPPNRNAVASDPVPSTTPAPGHNPVGVDAPAHAPPKAARGLATLGWKAQSLWDWLKVRPHGGARWQGLHPVTREVSRSGRHELASVDYPPEK